MIDDDATDPSEEELAEAAALAEALEGRGGDGTLPEDAAEAAALLRYAGPEGELSGARAEAILEDLVAGGLPERAPVARRPWWRGLWGAAVMSGLTAAAVALLVVRSADRVGMSPHAGASPASPAPSAVAPPSRAEAELGRMPVPLPAPPASLLSAQAEASKGKAERRRLDAEMARYRETVLRDLEARYPARFGARARAGGAR
ncbi:MAG: hypothetical protein OXT09_27665 [Myxococcales bacterium]|nr:hypothetical protein [Myxococcales bacterium]